jgi:replicative DNA helicase
MYSLDLEQQLLAALLKHPDIYNEIASFIDEKDFFSKNTIVNKTIFCLLKEAFESGQNIDEVVLTQRIKSLGISFEDNINIGDYIQALSLKKIARDKVLDTCKELKKLTVRRSIFDNSVKLAEKMKSMPSNKPYAEIIEQADTIYNEQINLYEVGESKPQNIYDEMESWIEDRGNNPIDDFGPAGPHPRVNEMFGSLLRPGNITVVVARSGVGKTQFCMDFCTKVSKEHQIPVLHFDNGEMSKEELIMRQCAALSGIPMHLIESGKWRTTGYGKLSAEQVVEKVRSVWAHVKGMKFYYYNVAGMDVDSMVNVMRRFYYSTVGRGNKMIFSFDYIKTTSETNSQNRSSWELVGKMIDRFKQFIQKEVQDDSGPLLSMITSVQSNRIGITNNRNADNVVDDESIVSLSDQIVQFSSHMFILRQKTMDELANEPEGFGSHKFIPVKTRHLGKDIHRAIEPVELVDGTKRKNYVNLDFNNFGITEKGDLQDVEDARRLVDISPIRNNEEHDLL